MSVTAPAALRGWILNLDDGGAAAENKRVVVGNRANEGWQRQRHTILRGKGAMVCLSVWREEAVPAIHSSEAEEGLRLKARSLAPGV